MIVKVSQRGGGQNLATHLLDKFSNESVRIMDIRGTIAQDLHGAFAEWRVMADGTRCTKYIFSVSLNHDEAKYSLTYEQALEYAKRFEQEFGLEAQDRAIVEHVKNGRPHYHLAYNRIIAAEMKAVQLSNDYYRAQDVTRQFCYDYGLPLPKGMEKAKSNNRFFNQEKYSNLYEKAAEDRTGLTKADHIATVTDIWDRSDSAKAFKAGLEEAGYALTLGDKADYVIVDPYGTPFNASKIIGYSNVQMEELRSFLEHDNADFKDLLEAAGSIIGIRKAAAAANERHMREDFSKQAHELNKRLEKIQTKRRGALDKKYNEALKRQKKETAALKEIQKLSGLAIRRARIGKKSAGIAAMLYRITGLRGVRRFMTLRKVTKVRQTQAEERAALKARHKAESSDFQRQHRNMNLVEQKERKELDKKIGLLSRQMAGSGKGDAGKSAEPRQLKNIKADMFKPRDPGRGDKGK